MSRLPRLAPLIAGALCSSVVGASLLAGHASAQSCTADLAVQMTQTPNPVLVGSLLTYAITIQNVGAGTATLVTLADTLPRSVALVSFTTTHGSCTTAGSGVHCDLGSIGPGATVNVTVVVRAVEAGALTNNTAHVSSPADCNSANDDRVLLATIQEDPFALLREFVAEFYVVILGRAPSAGEVDEWVQFLVANPQDAERIVQGFFHSGEFLHFRRGRIADYVALLYATVLGRAPSAAEVAAWEPIVVDRLNRIIPGFVDSVEFQTLLRTTPPGVVVTRLYQEVLGRNPDAAELAAWLDILARTQNWFGVSLGFLNSREYLDGSRTFADHVAVLYRTFLGRTPAAAEVDAWLGIVAGLLTEIESGFVDSREFQALLDELL